MVSRKKRQDDGGAHFENGRPFRAARLADTDDIEARRRAPMRLMPDYAGDLPLRWGRPLEQVDLSPWLLDRLAQWQHDFDVNFDPYAGGWQSPEAREKWKQEAHGLVIELRTALPRDIELKVDLWPLEPIDD
jgi:hypothetical protein